MNSPEYSFPILGQSNCILAYVVMMTMEIIYRKKGFSHKNN